MEVGFRSARLAKLCTDPTMRQRRLGRERSTKVLLRLNQLAAAEHLGELMSRPQGRCKPLADERDETFSLDLDGQSHLIIEITDRPAPRTDDNDIRLDEVKSVTVTDLSTPN